MTTRRKKMLSFNWIDYSILAILAFYAYEGYASGFIRALLDLANFILSFLIGLRFYGFLAGILLASLSVPQGFANAIGFFIIAFLAEIIIGILIRNFVAFDIFDFLSEKSIFQGLSKILGILTGVLSGMVLIAFILILIVTLPLSKPVKSAVSSSGIGSLLLIKSQGLEKTVNQIFGGAINETINFLTIEPEGNEVVSLNFKTNYISPDPSAEQEMFNLVNKERLAKGLRELIFDNELTAVGRRHCEDMFKRGYFSHYTPEGFSPFNRMDQAGIIYEAAGENLALSPNTDIAMQGLMGSPGHRENILSTSFGRVGIGVIDGGVYGEMFCQEFMD